MAAMSLGGHCIISEDTVTIATCGHGNMFHAIILLIVHVSHKDQTMHTNSTIYMQ